MSVLVLVGLGIGMVPSRVADANAACLPAGTRTVIVVARTGPHSQTMIRPADGVLPYVGPEGRTMVTIGSLLRALPEQVHYNPRYQKPRVTWNDGDRHRDRTAVFEHNGHTMVIYFPWGRDTASKIEVDGIQYATTPMPYLCGGRTFVPLRFMADALDMGITWDQNSLTATVTTYEMFFPGHAEMEHNVNIATEDGLIGAVGMSYYWESTERPLRISPWFYRMVTLSMQKANEEVQLAWHDNGIRPARRAPDDAGPERPAYPFIVTGEDDYGRTWVREVWPWGEWYYVQQQTAQDILTTYRRTAANLDVMPTGAVETAIVGSGMTLTVGSIAQGTAGAWLAEMGFASMLTRIVAVSGSATLAGIVVWLGSTALQYDVERAQIDIADCLRRSHVRGVGIRNWYIPPLSDTITPAIYKAVLHLENENPTLEPTHGLRHHVIASSRGRVILYGMSCKPWDGQSSIWTPGFRVN